MEKLTLGITREETMLVAIQHTAKAVQSGSLEVLATPVLATLAEKTAWQSVLPFLEENLDTVGTRITLNHTSPTPVGMQVWCQTRLINIEERKLTFEITAKDAQGVIAFGTHERFIVFAPKFQAKANAKSALSPV